ncbi:hypothetical protein Hanom_Chr02g00130891 [Helianthus anomalus]
MRREGDRERRGREREERCDVVFRRQTRRRRRNHGGGGGSCLRRGSPVLDGGDSRHHCRR